MNINELIEPIEIKSRVFLKNIETASIQNEADKENACLLLKDICDYKKAVEKQKKELTAPLKKEAKEIDDKFKQPLQFLNEADALVRSKINFFLNEQKRKIEEAAAAAKKIEEDKALEQAEKLEQLKAGAGEYDDVTRAAMIEAITDKQDKIINDTAKTEKINQSSATSTVRQIWTFRVVDFSKIPADYLILDEKKVRDAIRGGCRDITGLEIFQQSQVAVK